METQPHAEIAGAGLGGLATAIALRQHGWSVRVHEREASPRVAGSGLSIFENGLKVFEALGVFDKAVGGARRGIWRETRDAQGRTTSKVTYAARMFEVSRRQVVSALLERAAEVGAEIVTSSEAIGADPAGALLTADGNRHPADLVVAADGIHSRIRDALGVAVRRKPLRDGAIRVMIERTAADRAAPDADANIEYWAGKRRILIAPCSDHELYVALTAPVTDQAGQRIPIDKESWTGSFPTLRPLIDRLDGEARWDRFEVVKLELLVKGPRRPARRCRACDGAEFGQGGACAMMNGLALPAYLDASPNVEDALRAWEGAERGLTDHTQRLSTFYSELTFWPDAFRSAVFWLVARVPPLRRQYARCANHVPTGAAGAVSQ